MPITTTIDLMNIDKIISIIRSLKEDGSPTMSTGSTAGSAGFGGSAQGPTAGYDMPLDGRSRMLKRLPPLYRKGLGKRMKKRKNK